jgi:hypothetical protein
MLHRAIVPCLIVPVAALAQARDMLDLPFLDSVETRFGTLSVGPLPQSAGQGLFWNGAPVAGPDAALVHIQAVLPMPQGGPDDWVLVSLEGDDSDCPTRFAFVTLSKDGAAATAPFGTCSKAIFDLRETEGTKVAMDMLGSDEGKLSVHVYRFDGVTVNETVNPLP